MQVRCARHDSRCTIKPNMMPHRKAAGMFARLCPALMAVHVRNGKCVIVFPKHDGALGWTDEPPIDHPRRLYSSARKNCTNSLSGIIDLPFIFSLWTLQNHQICTRTSHTLSKLKLSCCPSLGACIVLHFVKTYTSRSVSTRLAWTQGGARSRNPKFLSTLQKEQILNQ